MEIQSLEEGPDEIRKGTLIVGCGVLVTGLIATTHALITQWAEPHGKPLVFGLYNAAPAQFSMLLGIVLIAAVTADTMSNAVRSAIGTLALFSFFIFAASMVRFTLFAVMFAVGLTLLLDPKTPRQRVVLVVGSLCFAASLGVGVRWKISSVFISHGLTVLHVQAPRANVWTAPPRFEGCPRIDVDNSIAIRKQLLVDAIRLLPEAGALGLGLGGFSRRSCFEGPEVHNSLLQASVEFGWMAGGALVLLLVSAFRSALVPLVRISPDFRFSAGGLLCGVAQCSSWPN